MKTRDQIEAEFRADLRTLLAKYNADLEIEEDPYDHSGNGTITVTIPSVYEHNTRVSDHVMIDLGRYVDAR
jgi:hypothetical protein